MSLKYHKTLTLLITIFYLSVLNANLFGQNRLVPGRIVNINGDTLEVLIKKAKWKSNPEKIDYIIASSNQVIRGNTSNIRMFQVKGEAAYFGTEVMVDRSSDIHGQLTRSAEPNWEKRKVFLKQLTGDRVSLFEYRTNKIHRYYYKDFGADNYEALIYKRYISNQRVKHNRSYRKQLQGLFTCGTSFELLQKLDYKLRDLVIYFKAAENCSDVVLAAAFKPELKPVTITWKPILGLNFMSAKLERTVIFGGRVIEEFNTESDNFNGLKLGARGSLPLSGKNDRWTAILEASYENINFEGTWRNVLYRTLTQDFRDDQTMKVDLHHIVINLGLTRNFKILENLSLYLSSAWSPGFTFDLSASAEVSVINNISSTSASPELREVGNFSFSFGVVFKAFSLESRYNTRRDLMGNSSLFRTNISTFGLIAGYKF